MEEIKNENLCRYCGKEIPDNAIACPYCGKKLVGHRTKIVPIIAVVAVLIIGAVVAVPMISEKSKEAKYDEAVSMVSNGEYIAAAQLFDSLGNYSDAKQQVYSICEKYVDDTSDSFVEEMRSYYSSDEKSSDAIVALIQESATFFDSLSDINVLQYKDELFDKYYTYGTALLDNSLLRSGGLIILQQIPQYNDSSDLISIYSDPDPEEQAAGRAIDVLYDRLKNPDSLVVKGIRAGDSIITGYIIYYSAQNGFGMQNDGYAVVKGGTLSATPEAMAKDAYNRAKLEINTEHAIVLSDNVNYYI